MFTKTPIPKILISPLPSFFRTSEIVEGTVLSHAAKKLFVDLKIATGIIYGAEYIKAVALIKNLKKGDSVKAKVVETINDDGYIELSLAAVEEESKWDYLNKAMGSKEAVASKVIGVNRGGLLLLINNTKAFLPASQLSLNHGLNLKNVDQQRMMDELRKLVGKELQVKIIAVDQKENKVVVSEKAVLEEANKKSETSYKIGDMVDGEISDISPFGAFIRFGSEPKKEGLIHISELSHSLISHPSVVVEKGQKVRAKIINIDSKYRFALSLKALEEDPWLKAGQKYSIGQVVEGEVFDVKDYGAFIKLDDDCIHGLCHISGFDNNIEKIKRTLAAGTRYKFQIEFMNAVDHRLSLKLIQGVCPEDRVPTEA